MTIQSFFGVESLKSFLEPSNMFAESKSLRIAPQNVSVESVQFFKESKLNSIEYINNNGEPRAITGLVFDSIGDFTPVVRYIVQDDITLFYALFIHSDNLAYHNKRKAMMSKLADSIDV